MNRDGSEDDVASRTPGNPVSKKGIEHPQSAKVRPSKIPDNKKIIKNAITKVCLAGEVKKKEREEIL
jgi:hypothetical protein